MLPSKEAKLMNNTSFSQIVLSALTREMKLNADALTVSGSVSNEAENKLLIWIRTKAINGSLQDHTKGYLCANTNCIAALLSMFDDTAGDDIDTTEDAQGALTIDWDTAKTVLINKISTNNYLYMLAGATPEDFLKTELVNGVWQIPVI